jgi:hypothetical protein
MKSLNSIRNTDGATFNVTPSGARLFSDRG